MADDSQLKKQIKVGTHINNHFVNFKKLGQDSMTIELANARMHRLDDLWQQFQNNDLSLQQLTPEDKVVIDPNKAYFTEDVLYDMMESYDRNLALYEAFIRVNSPDQTIDQAIVAHNSTMISNDTQDVSALLKSLPQISIEKFACKSSDWPPFRDLFKSLVHAQKISSVIKLSLLRSYLVGEALDVIKNIPISETNYDVAWNALVLHYENERRLVNQHLSDLFAVKPMTHESHSEVKRILSEMSGPLESLKALGRPTDQWSDVLVFMMAKNLHKNVRRDWEKNLGTSVKTPNLDRMQTFLKTQSTMLEAVERSTKLVSSATQPRTPTKKPAPGTSLATSVENLTKESPKTSEPKSCAFCKNDHYLNRCPQLLEKSIEDRRAFVTQKRLCFNCLGPHQMKDCKSKFRCYTCKAKHHTILHSQKKPQPSDSSIDQSTCQVSASPNVVPNQSPQQTGAIPTAYSHFTSYHGRTGVLLGTARIFVEGPDGRKIKVRALIDNCSQPSFISENIFKKLELPSTSTNAPILAVGGVPAVTGREVTSFKIRPHFSSRFSCEVKALVVPRVCSYTPPQTQIVSSLVYLSHINLADPTFLDTDEIDVLLGADVHARIIQESIVRGRPEEPIATSSLLGWVISGSVPLSAQVASLTSLHCSGVDDISETLRNFWRVEELPAIKYLTPAEEQCEKHYSDTVKRDEDGRYVVKLPFKSPESPRFGDSYRKAVIMLKRMEEKFEVDPELKKLYFDFMVEYISSGHMIPITEDSPLYKPRDECFFLPHHGVLKPSSSTTKLRTVFNGSSKSNLNLSLNSQLHTGPNLLPELPDLICAWRTYRYVFVADIKQMFRQIRVNESDLHHQAIVWRFNPNDPIQTYFLTTVTYGLVSSPYQANRTLRQLASDYKSTYPLASDVLSKECYMDDMLSGDHSMGLVLEKQNQLINMLKKGGFELRKWLSNDPEILSHLPSDHLANEQAAIFEAASSFSVLGLHWQAKDDLFTFSVNIAPSSGVHTKRTILSTIAQIFDPMGWLAPVIISAKIFMQSLWLLKCDWDDPLPSEYVEQWKSWAAKLDSINSITIPRFVHYSPNARTCEIHGFADASQRAYSAVVYLRIISDGEVNCSLQLAKTRVAPLKTLSIPRLELLGAHVLAKLTQHFISVIPLEINSIHLWSDSKDVLFWLRSHPSRWQTFVANRCSDIHTVVPNAYWHYVKSADNPADVASRGIGPELLADHPLWWHSPSWLKNISDPWPTNPDDLLEHAPTEERPSKIDLVANAATQEPSPEEKMWDLGFRYSTLSQLFRVTAYIIRILFKMNDKILVKNSVNSSFKFLDFLDFSDMNGQYLSPKEMHNAKLFWVYLVQQAYFKKEIKALQNPADNPNFKLKGALLNLNPIVKDGFLRVGGRIDQSLLPYGQKHPFILPGNCFLGQLIARFAHAVALHGGVQTTLGVIRQEYWLINGRKTVKQIIQECKPCVRFRASVQTQLMGDLPQARVQPTDPFAHSGVDYAGPFSIRLTKTRGKGTMKGWICLFICLSTRGVHLEFVEDYSTEAFIAAFSRFTSRRGKCTELWSDKGTNFVGADLELREMLRESSPYLFEVKKELASQGVKWIFNSPGAPHFGGFWEAGVKSTKHHLRRVIGESILTFSEMSTLLCRIEACLNSRPLLPLSDDSADLNYLTPAHFLIQRSSFLVPEPDFTSVKVSPARRWHIVSQKAQHFWTRWRKEYLSALQPRAKWLKKARSLQTGDVVFIRHEDTPPGRWPLARVLKTYPDQYGHNRVCDVVYKKEPYLKQKPRVLQRPSVKLVLLVPTERGVKTTPTTVETLASNLVLLQAAL